MKKEERKWPPDTISRLLKHVGRSQLQARPRDVPLSTQTSTSVPHWSHHSSHRSRISTSTTFCQPTPAHCTSLSTQHARLSGFSSRWSDSLELTARWTVRSGVLCWQIQTILFRLC